MSPNDFQLPEFERFEMAPRLPIDKIWRVLWSIDPAWLKKLQPSVINEIKEIYINQEILRAEMVAQIYHEQVRAMKEIQEKIQLG